MVVPGERIELPTNGLQNRCSTAELTRQINGLGATLTESLQDYYRTPGTWIVVCSNGSHNPLAPLAIVDSRAFEVTRIFRANNCGAKPPTTTMKSAKCRRQEPSRGCISRGA
jgi:hypothetical protein